jgi:3-oxoacyl-[acyl-carrier-protein] synthase-3
MGTAILGTGSYVPSRTVTSDELARRVGVEARWIVEKTGILERRVAAADEATSDLATHAAQRALEAAHLSPKDLDLIVLATSTPDQPMPASACRVQAKLGAPQAAAFDVDSVCSGFVYALVAANAMLTADSAARTALVVGADIYSRILNYADPRTAVLFGDGAGAVVLGRRRSAGPGILATTLGADGTFAELVQIPAGGSRRPASWSTVAGGEHFFAMRGGDVRRLANRVFPSVVSRLLKASSLELDQVDLIAPHQANGTMLAGWATDLGLRPGVMHLTVDRYGNTGAASVPITLDDAVRGGRLRDIAKVLLVAFGGGMSWGGVALEWHAPTSKAIV